MSEYEMKLCEKIFRNIDLLRQIFELLDYENQVKLATVCQHFYDYFREFICTEKYRTITVTKHQELVLIQTEYSQNELRFSNDGLEYFLQVYAKDIENLTEKYGLAINIQNLANLKSISYNHMMVTNQHLQMLANHCPHLQQLEICGCCNEHLDIIHLGEDLKVQTLMKMKMLQRFTLKKSTDFQGKSNALQDILMQLKLRFYNLKSFLLLLDDDLHHLESAEATSASLKELDIYGPFYSSYLSWNLKTYLDKFENLISLTLTLSDVVNDEVLISLANSCPKLQRLAFKFTTFEGIQKFAILKDLADLSFYWCKGLSYDNLKEILSEMTLEKFSSTYTKYYGLFQYYFVAPTLKSIHIDAFHSFEFRSA